MFCKYRLTFSVILIHLKFLKWILKNLNIQPLLHGQKRKNHLKKTKQNKKKQQIPVSGKYFQTKSS